MSKRLVICADGTWNDPAQTDQGVPCPSNVVLIASVVLPQDASNTPQIVYYHAGVGERGGLWDHLTGGAFGVGISHNIKEIYLFLINNYVPGDEIYLFGFSRGAYTVRSIAGFIRNCGILKPQFMSRYGEAYEMYRDRSDASKPKSTLAINFRSRYSYPDFNIRFIGVWDTVGALGIPVIPLRFWTRELYEFHDVELSSHVDYAFQALAIDERRKPFLPAIWTKQPDSPASQVVEQAWFPGVHCDVGGGYKSRGLSDAALLWICDRAGRCGLALDQRRLPTSGNPAGPMGDSMTFFYRLLGEGIRSLGTSGPLSFEGLHRSALDRTQRQANYRPSNLGAFVAQHPVILSP